MREEESMEGRSRNRMFNAVLLLIGLFFLVFFVVLIALTGVILHTIRENHGGQSAQSVQQQMEAMKLLMDNWEADKQLEDALKKIRANKQKDNNSVDVIGGISPRQRRQVLRETDHPVKTPFPSSSYGGGTLYVRWGRVNCSQTPSTSTLYSGIIGISHVGHAGGGSNHLCLPFEPEYGYQQKGLQYTVGAGGSLLQGVEYRAENIYPFKNDNNNDLSVNKEDAVCAVCYASSRSVTLMIPAKRSCPHEWTLEYAGYLMAANHKNHRTNYLCVDESPEGKPSGENTNGGSYLYPVEGGCGALPCPNYREGLELACVVCTK